MTSQIHTAQLVPTGAELVGRAVALQPLLRAHASQGEIDRRQADEVIAGLTEAGLFRLLKPNRFGGYLTDVRTVLGVTEALGTADGSAAWLVGLGATAAWLTAHSSPRAQHEVFGTDPNARIAGSAHPAPARWVDGGLVVSGRWGYASGSPHATWAAIAVVVGGDAGQSPEPYMCLVPASEVRLEDTWHVVGMRGTGSNTWAADDLFVPEDRLISMSAVDSEMAGAGVEPQYRLPFAPLATLALVGPLLGLGQAALSLVIAAAPGKGMHHTFFARRSDSVGVQVQIAEAALALQTARLHAYDIADGLDRTAAEGRSLTYDERARIRARCGYATQQVLEAIHVLVNVHGAATFAESNPLQRYWRDANTAARHAGFNAVVGYEVLGKALLGVQERVSPMV
ncbi:MAG TPA: acyl-CoA dehydrogenase family protein [Mycobacterium sp.]|nr:acyl-CoA dehydrogenase family protein [Mycobacterium sp.]